MLILKRVTYDYEFMKCHISDELIGYGDYYYQDDTDGLIVKARVLHELKAKRKAEQFDYSKLSRARDQQEYKEILKAAERQLKEDTLLNRKIQGEGAY